MSVLSSKPWHSLTEPVAWTKTRVTQRGSFSVSADTDNDNYLLLNAISHVYITRRSSWPVVYVHLSTVLIRFAMLKVFASSLNRCKTRTVSDGCVVFLWNCTNKKCPRAHTHTHTDMFGSPVDRCLLPFFCVCWSIAKPAFKVQTTTNCVKVCRRCAC